MNGHVWIGVNDIDEEGTFVSTDGSVLTFTNWKTGQPDNWGSGEDAVVIRWSDGFWGDVPSTNLYKIICIYNIINDNLGEFWGYEYNLY